MTQENKELLLKDLCARLPYEVRCKYYNVYENCYEEGTISGFERKEYIEIGGECVNVEEVKPYLFPMSSMTEEQENELVRIIYSNNNDTTISCLTVDYLIQNHFDYRGLIPMGLAIDATGKNIY